MADPLLVLVTGTGRSGTSTIAGTLSMLGLSVPGPYHAANDSNPKGFYESQWSVRFHKSIIRAAEIHDFDSRPRAYAKVQDAVTAEQRARLETFVRRSSAEAEQVVVKDPRSAWTQELWREAAEAAGLSIRYLTMLRHPAEVVGSRTTYYANPDDETARRRYETFNVARWINGSLVSERHTRGRRRTFVRYTDLLEDWRPVLVRVGEELGLTYSADLGTDAPHPVDDFIDPALRRHRVTWDDLSVPAALQDLAEEVWVEVNRIHDAAGDDPAASAALDLLAERYEQLFAEADAISHDATEEVRLRGAAQVKAAEAAAGSPRASQGPVQAVPAAPDLEQVSGRALAGALADRVRTRVGGRLRRR